ncbi:protein of unknown function [Halorientalis persicus]|uniref:Protein-glutamine gamma-glutamyltransferase-like C-terminal domain-containing protein n=1 Tax=Halorientalis persicus TaxID=1367881 RepID=A0A1H8GYL7_9EURY|nr:DUF4129 domain-containing protein [Halorientalis persicus]SEN48338.1 protein of unknown function [Halorientalis persicus]
MSRQALLVVLAAVVAALSFAVVGATIDGSRPSPTVESEGGDLRTPSPRSSAAGAANLTDPGGDSATAVPDPPDGINSRLAAYLPAVNPLLLLAVTALVIATLWWLGVRGRTEQERATDRPGTDRDRPDDGGGEEGTTMPVPDAAADNEVYRAWRTMVTELDVPYGETTTPREFAREAVRTGADTEPVERLTDLFDRVRYGAAEPTEDREERARDALNALDGEGED